MPDGGSQQCGGDPVARNFVSVDGTKVAAGAGIVAAASSCPGAGFAPVQRTPRNVVSPFTVWVSPCLSRTSR